MPSQRKILIWENGDGTKRIAIERGLICALGKYLGRRVGLSAELECIVFPLDVAHEHANSNRNKSALNNAQAVDLTRSFAD